MSRKKTETASAESALVRCRYEWDFSHSGCNNWVPATKTSWASA